MAALTALSCTPAWAQAPAPTPTPAPMGPKVAVRGVPDVQVMVAPGQIALVYPKPVPEDTVRGQIASVAKALGSPAESVVVDTHRLSREAPAKAGGEAPEMTSGSFKTAAALIDPASGTLAVEPLLIGLQDLHAVNITFITPAGFVYRGGTQSADARVALEFAGGEGAYTFLANIQSRPLDGFRLTLEKAAPSGPVSGSPRAPLAALLVGVLALGGAAATFVALRRTGGR